MAEHAHHHPDGSRPPLVFVRTWGVEGDYLGALAEHVDADQPIIGIDPPSAERCARLDRVGDWVAYRARTARLALPLRAVPPRRVVLRWRRRTRARPSARRRGRGSGVPRPDRHVAASQPPAHRDGEPAAAPITLQALEPPQRRAHLRKFGRRLPVPGAQVRSREDRARDPQTARRRSRRRSPRSSRSCGRSGCRSSSTSRAPFTNR